MSQVFTLITPEEKAFFAKRLADLCTEKQEKVLELIPAFEAVVLGSVLKLFRNRIRFNALYNFMLAKSAPQEEVAKLLSSGKGMPDYEALYRFGEGMMGVLLPDKKSAIATLLGGQLGAKSSTIIKGLTLSYALYGYRLKEFDYDALRDYKSFGEFYQPYTSDFYALTPAKIQVALVDILVLNDVLKGDSFVFDEPFVAADDRPARNYKLIAAVIAGIVLLAIGLFFAFRSGGTTEVVEKEDADQIIPIDSLNKLNDSLTKAVVDSAKVTTDSLVTLTWPEGKPFQVPKESLVVAFHAYVTDSTVVSPLELTCTELDFSDKTELLSSPTTYLFKQIASGMNKFKEVDVQVQVASEKGAIVAKEHAYVVKNRLVGEGLNQKRITVATLPNSSNNQIIFSFKKRSSLK
ncbi:hypothetical protein [Aquirufa antheringensis]|jgi:hypothetical protein|uniref:Uncharacterized protein n=1 Tax=Aquirufa antheringensis TaxID=2516559 RepID=A0A4Q9BDC3_9BACT|nr:hypothetical protein [Aquirufa antheringensis]MCZ2486126.1 hypothetical protein [Aquirufa antheringensis]TBH73098.1 hypothetical protein EWU20_06905 [Aquirufa antheringensis]USQ04614.1 hypothetical protein G9X63_11000 [Aquirufa antheringensis]